ncbi:MAG: low-specificity L-threonine aldolase [Halomonas sp.]|uniref:low-specificity L-threonine aldolase n=1 Tax=Halomonas sp. TaxID=1486246 RepID=UPI00184D8401|nr:low-specificity L-threonine aldolase [Halomonas sp.]NWN81719.1 low-specificity L-threonine aldolase [Halomonas sp.]
MIDLRSDTVTRPGAAMRDAMHAAPVGDDVWGDDPSVARFEAAVAERTGKAAALLFPSGTQSNLAALLAHCQRGDEYIAGQQAHTYKYEGGGAAVLGGIQPQPVEHADDGSLPLARLRAAIKPDDFHFARTRLLALENTIGGRVIDADYMQQATDLAREHGLATHLDGARLFNAAVATDTPLATLCEPFDTVSLCFSKGLGAPMGSALAGSQALIDAARRWRKVLGGGMRQSGIIAAACHYALDHQVADLADDHRRAEHLAAGLGSLPEIEVSSQATNMVFLRVPEPHIAPLRAWLAERDILIDVLYDTRLVVHRDLDDADIDAILAAFEDYLTNSPVA